MFQYLVKYLTSTILDFWSEGKINLCAISIAIEISLTLSYFNVLNYINKHKIHKKNPFTKMPLFSCYVTSDFCDPMDSSLTGSSVHGIFQARILKWIAISSPKRSSQPRDQTCNSCVSCCRQADSLPLSHQGIPY